VLTRDGDRFVLTAVPAGAGSLDQRAQLAVQSCGWQLAVAREILEAAPPSAAELALLRGYDPARWFLG
jgi:hypothetical protein